jgi:hypothetical protein
LGTLFERSLDPGKRAQLGAHYTSRDDILLIVEPVLMEPLRRKWQTVEAEARDRFARAAATDHPPTRTKYVAARELHEKRERWLHPATPGPSPSKAMERGEKGEKARTLTNLYNQRPTWLQLAHEKLDQAVWAAYGWPQDLTEEEISGRLLALNLARAA